jgi:hypothetical protein
MSAQLKGNALAGHWIRYFGQKAVIVGLDGHEGPYFPKIQQKRPV